jgi:type I restriction enzyme S subunit
MSEWKEYKLGDFLKVKHGYAFKGENIVTEETPNILVTPGNFNIGGGFKSDKFKYYKGDEFPKEYILTSGDIVVTMTDLSKDSDTLGYSAKIPYSTNHNYLHNQRIGLVQFVNENVCKDFVYWLMRTREYQNYIVGSASGTSIMHTSPSRIEDYRCLIPSSLSEQERIASILSSLDDKIDLLHRENKTLEAMAETLFRQWFIEEAKEDWKEGKLGDLIDVKYGKDHKKLLDGKIPVLGSGGIMRYADTALYDKESVLIPRKGSLNNVMYINEPFWTVDTMFYTEMRQLNVAKFVYHFMKNQDLANMNVGSAVPSMTVEVLNNIPIDIPPQNIFDKFEGAVSLLYSKKEHNNKQIQTLIQQRDSLLPKLMSGEIKV